MYTLLATFVTIYLLGVCLAETAFEGTDLGCWKDGKDRALSGHQELSDSMTNDQCMDICRAKGFLYAGTQWRNECFCGDKHDRYGHAENCDLSCAGDPTQNCGGDWALHVYDLQVRVALEVDLGCWKDQRDRAMQGADLSSTSMTNKKCAQFCKSKGFRYYATEYGMECYCADEYERHGRAHNCNLPCAGDEDQNCGGEWALHVFEFGSKYPNPTPTPPAKTSPNTVTANAPMQTPGPTTTKRQTVAVVGIMQTPVAGRPEPQKAPIPAHPKQVVTLKANAETHSKTKGPEKEHGAAILSLIPQMTAPLKAPQPTNDTATLKPPEVPTESVQPTAKGPEPPKTLQSTDASTALKPYVVPVVSGAATTIKAMHTTSQPPSSPVQQLLDADIKEPQFVPGPNVLNPPADPDTATTTLSIVKLTPLKTILSGQGVALDKTFAATLAPTPKPTPPNRAKTDEKTRTDGTGEAPVQAAAAIQMPMNVQKAESTTTELGQWSTPTVSTVPANAKTTTTRGSIRLKSTSVPVPTVTKMLLTTNMPTLADVVVPNQDPYPAPNPTTRIPPRTEAVALNHGPNPTPRPTSHLQKLAAIPLFPSVVPLHEQPPAITLPTPTSPQYKGCMAERTQFAANGLNIEPEFQVGSCRFLAKQCDERQCYCVSSKTGRRKRRKVIVPVEHKYDCLTRVRRCYRKLFKLMLADDNTGGNKENGSDDVMGDSYVPTCIDGGRYAPKQCDKTGTCWCVVTRNGREIKGTRNIDGSKVSC